MTCKYCGSEMTGAFCSNCGRAADNIVNNDSSFFRPPVPQEQPEVLLWGIMGLAFSWVPILGLIFCIKARNLAKEFVLINGSIYGSAKVGKILATVGLVLSIVIPIYEILYFAFIFALIGASTHLYNYY